MDFCANAIKIMFVDAIFSHTLAVTWNMHLHPKSLIIFTLIYSRKRKYIKKEYDTV